MKKRFGKILIERDQFLYTKRQSFLQKRIKGLGFIRKELEHKIILILLKDTETNEKFYFF